MKTSKVKSINEPPFLKNGNSSLSVMIGLARYQYLVKAGQPNSFHSKA